MTKLRVHCDRCGLLVQERGPTTSPWSRLAATFGPLLQEHKLHSLALCGGCASDLVAWLGTPPAESEVPTPAVPDA